VTKSITARRSCDFTKARELLDDDLYHEIVSETTTENVRIY
jgi:hypothetical protein